VTFTLTYGEVPRGRLALCEDSFRTITIAVNQGSAAKLLRAQRADPLVIARVHQAAPVVTGPIGVYDEPPSTATA
jgi:hypothetical protein